MAYRSTISPSAAGALVSLVAILAVSLPCRDATASPANRDMTGAWIGRTLVPAGQRPPKTGRYVLETEIPSPHRILQSGTAGDTVNVAGRIDIVVDKAMVIRRAWRE